VYARQANTEHPTAKREEDILIFTDNSIGHPRPQNPTMKQKTSEWLYGGLKL
jgi:hypothetical protein